MELLSSPPSPFARKCRVVLVETGQSDIKVNDVTASPLGGDATINAANPSGKIPTLVRDDGPALYDSRVICRFLDDRAGAGLYPEGRLWDVLALEANADAIMEAAVGMIYEMRFREAPGLIWDAWLDAQWVKVTRSLDVLEQRSMPLLEGPLNMAQIGVGCALSYLDFRHEARDWRAGRGALVDWYARFSQRESMVATDPA